MDTLYVQDSFEFIIPLSFFLPKWRNSRASVLLQSLLLTDALLYCASLFISVPVGQLLENSAKSQILLKNATWFSKKERKSQ